jgi:uncharacterized RDD family membrane protein YckC
MTTPSQSNSQPPPPGQSSQPAATPIQSWEAPPSVPGPAAGIEFAPHGPRLVAYIIDGIILTLVIVLVTIIAAPIVVATIGTDQFVFTGEDIQSLSPAFWTVVLLYVVFVFVVTVAYFPFFWARTGQTPGMRPFDLYVVRDADGGKISGGSAVLRLIGLWIAQWIFYIGIIWIFIDARHRGWQDLIGGTVMVKRAGSPA